MAKQSSLGFKLLIKTYIDTSNTLLSVDDRRRHDNYILVQHDMWFVDIVPREIAGAEKDCRRFGSCPLSSSGW